MSKKNKTVIRKELKEGEFTTVKLSILHDKRISPNALRILLSLLSDKEDFNASYKLFENRFGINNRTVRDAFKLLEELGYVRLTEQKRGHYYEVSEYGNLNTSKGKDEVQTEETLVPIDDKLEERINKNFELFKNYIFSIGVYMEHDTSILKTVNELSEEYTDKDGLIDFYKFKSDIEKLVNKKKLEQYKLLLPIRDKRTKVIANKAVTTYEKWLKNEIFELGALPTESECKKKWMHIKMKNQKFTTDYETARFDRAEEEYYDNQ